MKYLFIIPFITSFFILVTCCNKLYPDEQLSTKRQDYNGDEIRIDGYYYYFISDNQYSRAVIHFLYRNGLILSTVVLGYELTEIEKEMISYYSSFNKTDWGVFLVDSNTISYEKVISADPAAGISSYIVRKSGYVKNDTTLHFTESYSSNSKETKTINEVWHFRQFNNKPDSTNVFIQ
jgi:hypothetical protein